MVNQKLLDYIKEKTDAGHPHQDIKAILMKVGWDEAEIEEGFQEVTQPVQTPVAAPVQSPQPQKMQIPPGLNPEKIAPKEQLAPVTEDVSFSSSPKKPPFKMIIGIMLIVVVLLLLAGGGYYLYSTNSNFFGTAPTPTLTPASSSTPISSPTPIGTPSPTPTPTPISSATPLPISQNDSTIEASLLTISTDGGTYHTAKGSYTGFCLNAYKSQSATSIDTAGGSLTCNTNITHTGFCACSTLKDTAGNVYCVDSAGVKNQTTNTCANVCTTSGACLQ